MVKTLFLLIIVLFGMFYFHTFKYFKAPVIEAKKDMTALPPELKHILGSQTGPSNYLTVTLRVPILMYHYIEYVQDSKDKMRNSLNITPNILEEQVKTLRDGGYTFISASQLYGMLSGKMEVPSKPILLTFDDGYRDFYEYAYPILKKYNAKATQYVISGFIDRPNHLLTEQLKQIDREGLVEIGVHTVNHLWLRGLNNKTVEYEIKESKNELEKLLGHSVTSFAYPYGAFDQQAIGDVQDAGFTNAMATLPGVSQALANKYFLYRVRPGFRTENTLLNYLAQYPPTPQ